MHPISDPDPEMVELLEGEEIRPASRVAAATAFNQKLVSLECHSFALCERVATQTFLLKRVSTYYIAAQLSCPALHSGAWISAIGTTAGVGECLAFQEEA